MYRIDLPDIPDFDQWRLYARTALLQKIPPKEIVWIGKGNPNLFTHNYPALESVSPEHCPIHVSKEFIRLARHVIHFHHREVSHALLYRLLWRLQFENKQLLKHVTDDDILHARSIEKSVCRDAYKLTAFLRFRGITNPEKEEQFIAWYETEHFSLPLKLDFFITRFKNMRWTIMTPYMAAHWNKKVLKIRFDSNKTAIPKADTLEDYWLTYYKNIFNPARVKKQAMLNHMPKKYWKNMPESTLIDGLIQDSHCRVRMMIEHQKNN